MSDVMETFQKILENIINIFFYIFSRLNKMIFTDWRPFLCILTLQGNCLYIDYLMF